MSGEAERDSRTEEPTEKKLQDAVDKGNVPMSREAITFGSLSGMMLAAVLVLPGASARLLASLATLFANAGLVRLAAREDAGSLIAAAAIAAAGAVLPVMAVVAAGGLLGALLQNLPQANGERIRPQFTRISPAAGWRRLFGRDGAAEFLKSVAKLAAVSLAAAAMVKLDLPAILDVLTAEPAQLPSTILALCRRVLAALCLIALMLAAADLALSRLRWRRQLRMTRQEIKDEFKQAEGDPMVKHRIRSLARQRRSRRMMAKVPEATVIIANPTHYAVALRYLRAEGGAPVVLAKGIDHLALRIRGIAEGAGIPVVENRPLARALYGQAELGQMIPPEFYKAVAEIIHFLELRRMYTAPAARR